MPRNTKSFTLQQEPRAKVALGSCVFATRLPKSGFGPREDGPLSSGRQSLALGRTDLRSPEDIKRGSENHRKKQGFQSQMH